MCAPSGRNPTAPGILHLLINDARAIGKFGISTSADKRLAPTAATATTAWRYASSYAHSYLAYEAEQRIRGLVRQASPAAIIERQEYVDLDLVPEADLVAIMKGVVIDGDAGDVIDPAR